MINDFTTYKETVIKNKKKYTLRINEYTKDENIIFTLTIYRTKRFLFKEIKVQLLRTVAKDTDKADIEKMINLGRYYISIFGGE